MFGFGKKEKEKKRDRKNKESKSSLFFTSSKEKNIFGLPKNDDWKLSDDSWRHIYDDDE